MGRGEVMEIICILCLMFSTTEIFFKWLIHHPPKKKMFRLHLCFTSELYRLCDT